MSSIDFISAVPTELAVHIFSRLSPSELSVCCLVSKYWQWIADSDECWKSHVANLIEGTLPVQANFKAFYLHLNSRAVRNITEMVLHIKDFLETLSLESPSREFRCFVPLHETISTEDKPICIDFTNKRIKAKNSENEILPFSLRTKFASINNFNIQTDYFYAEKRKLMVLIRETSEAYNKLAPEKVSLNPLYESPFFLSFEQGSFHYRNLFHQVLTRFVDQKTMQLWDQYRSSKKEAENRLSILGVVVAAFVVFGEFF